MPMSNKFDESHMSQKRLIKGVETIVWLIAGQLAIGLVVGSLFITSFLASPLRPLVYLQIAAAAVLFGGGLILIATVIVRYRSQILVSVRKRR